MARLPVVVLGGSAGSIEALQRVVAGLPANFPAAIFAVTHFSPSGTSALPRILSRPGHIPAAFAVDGDAVEPGRILVPPSGCNLGFFDGAIRLLDDTANVRFRPSIDLLFSNAAAAFGSAVCGVLLSGMLDDGVDGLVAIRRAGGTVLAQAPVDAIFPSMPAAALAAGVVDGVYNADELSRAIVAWSDDLTRRSFKPTG